MPNLINMGKNCCVQDPCNPDCNGTYDIDAATFTAISPVIGGTNSQIDSWDGTTVSILSPWEEEDMNTTNRCNKTQSNILDCVVTKLADQVESRRFEPNYGSANGAPGTQGVGIRLIQGHGTFTGSGVAPLGGFPVYEWGGGPIRWLDTKREFYVLETLTCGVSLSILPGKRFSVGLNITWHCQTRTQRCDPPTVVEETLEIDKEAAYNYRICDFELCLDRKMPECDSSFPQVGEFVLPVFKYPGLGRVCCGKGRVAHPPNPCNGQGVNDRTFIDILGPYTLVSRNYGTGIRSYEDCEEICGPLTLNLDYVFTTGQNNVRANGLRYIRVQTPVSGRYGYQINPGSPPPDQWMLSGGGRIQGCPPGTPPGPPGTQHPPDYPPGILYIDNLKPVRDAIPSPDNWYWFPCGSPPFSTTTVYDPGFVATPADVWTEIEEPLHATQVQLTLSQCQPGIVPM